MAEAESPVHLLRATLITGEPRTVVIAAPARGGTSLLASILHHVGVPMDAPPPKYEHVRLRRAFEKDDDKGFLKEVRHLDETYPIWGWKLPMASRHLGKLAATLRNPHFVIVFKDAASIALRKRINRAKVREVDPTREVSRQEDVARSIAKALGLQLKLINFATATKHPCLLVSYEKSMKDIPGLVRAVAGFSGMPSDGLAVEAIVAALAKDHEGYRQDNATRVENAIQKAAGGGAAGSAA